MKFYEHYMSDAKIVHPKTGRERFVINAPKIVDMPKQLEGKRIITIVNDDTLYFSFGFNDGEDKPFAVAMGSWDNPGKTVVTNDMDPNINQVYLKLYTPAKGNEPMSYGGEVRVHPPFKGYQEFPQDKNAYFFTDFNQPDEVCTAGDTLDDPLDCED